MHDIWRDTKLVNRRYIVGEMSLLDVTTNSVFTKAVEPLLQAGEKEEIDTMFAGLSEKYKDVSALRQALRDDPSLLGLDENQTKFLLSLFADKLSAAQY